MVCNSVLNWFFTPKHLNKNWKTDKFLLKNFQIRAQSLINLGLRFFRNMAPPSNDAPYCLLHSYKKLETFNKQFWRKYLKTQIFDPSLPLIPRLRFFSKFWQCHFFTLLTPNFMQSSRKNNWVLSEIFHDRHTDRRTHRWTNKGDY